MRIFDTFSKAANVLFPSDIYCAACGNLIDHTRPYALCDRCVREIEWHTDDVRTCRACGKALAPYRTGGICGDCREWERSFDGGVSCCTYSGWARDLVRAMKYKDAAWIASGIAEAMYDRWMQISDIAEAMYDRSVQVSDIAEAMYDRRVQKSDIAGNPHTEAAARMYTTLPERNLSDAVLSNTPSVPMTRSRRDAALPNTASAPAIPVTENFRNIAIPIIIPVPMTEAKKRTRGYDQAELIAKKLAQRLGAPFAGDILRRKRDTAVMSELGIYERRANMADAFEIDRYARKLIESGELTLGDILLVDDVFTTGSTANACAAVLKDAGAGKVTLFTFASGADGNPSLPEEEEQSPIQ
ncbi:MAG: double zinc ribbon domain-containing protein [Clostridiales Family XIII bacterium]|jgi:predicted amidophosphoribosyltransferase|nr:double zinc ribbon domain-containing protein [Clostridiales Family XIII bacterium]